jgi:DNA helicase IV
MVWRVLMRRCPSRSMTVVGDVAQTGSVAGARSWSDVLDPYAQGRWRLEPLSLNYRTPAEIMDVAADVLREIDPGLTAPAAVRDGYAPPWSQQVSDLVAALPQLIKAELTAVGEGRLAIIAPVQILDDVSARPEVRSTIAFGDDPDALDAPAVMLTPQQSKGLEFDAVLVLEPQLILRDSSSGTRDLYVAVTRATQRLGIVHTGELPRLLSRATPAKG